eukprot:scaffold26321_cov75-Isochrysis_galbana.AAC.1
MTRGRVSLGGVRVGCGGRGRGKGAGQRWAPSPGAARVPVCRCVGSRGLPDLGPGAGTPPTTTTGSGGFVSSWASIPGSSPLSRAACTRRTLPPVAPGIRAPGRGSGRRHRGTGGAPRWPRRRRAARPLLVSGAAGTRQTPEKG